MQWVLNDTRAAPAQGLGRLLLALLATLWIAPFAASGQEATEESELALASRLEENGVQLLNRGKFAAAEPLLKRALAIREKHLHPEDPDVRQSLNNLAGLYTHQGKYAEAVPLFRRSLAIREKVLGPDHPDVALSLNNLAVLYAHQGKYAEAVPLLRRALAIREKALGPEHPDVTGNINNLAGLYHSQGKYTEAEPLLRRALAIREKVLGPDHPDTAASLHNLAFLYVHQGKYADAEPLYRRALAISEKALGPEHPDTASIVISLAGLYHAQGKYAEAEPLLRRALAIREKGLGPEHPDVADSLGSLARLHLDQGNYAEAEPLLHRALAIREKALGADHSDVAQILTELARLYRHQGKYAEAESLHRRALAIREKALGPDHPYTAMGLHNLALLCEDRGKYAEAEPLGRRALAILEKVLGPDHPDTASCLSHLAYLYDSQGRDAEAEPLFRRALAIREKALGPDHPDTGTSLHGLGVCYGSQGKHAEAEPLFRRALAIWEKALGPDHPDLACSFNNLAFLSALLGDLPLAWEHAERSHRICLRARRAASESALTRASFLSAHLAADLLPCLSLALGKPVDVLVLAEEERALGLRELLAEARAGADARLPREDKEKVGAALGRMNALTAQIEKLAAKRIDPAPARQELQRAEMDYDALMAQLRKRYEQFVATETASAVTSDQIAKSEVLRDATAIVGWVEFDKWAWGFVARTEGVRWEDLSQFGKPDDLRERVRRVAQALSERRPPEELAPDLAEIHRSRFAPLRKHLEGIQRVIVIAQRWAAMIPAEAWLVGMPTKEQADPAAWAWLANRYEISYAPSATTLDILCRQRTARAKKDWERPLFALADPPFSTEQLAEMKSEAKAATAAAGEGTLGATPKFPLGRARSSKSLSVAPPQAASAFLPLNRAIRFDRGAAPPRLPGTRREAEVLAKLFGAEKSLLLVGPDASERKLFEASERGELAKCRYVHLATHGLADGERPELSALLLARATEDRDYDGLLQMREVFHLQLDADLVVLSACQTGLGKRLSGEGVVGLSTAFFFAGTPSLVMSLWNVPDASTALLMHRFYSNLRAGQRKAAALREAKHWLRSLTWRELVELGQNEPSLGDLTRALGEVTVSPRGEPVADRPFAHPYYWAGFVLTGDPR